MPKEEWQFKKGNSGRKKGSKNKRTLFFQRVYQRCMEADFHPADPLIDIAMDEEAPQALRIDMCKTLLEYMEGKQPDSKPLIPQSPTDSVESAGKMMQEAIERAKTNEPNPAPTIS